MLNCVTSILGSLYLGKILDKYRCYKSMQIYISIACLIIILATYLILEFNLPEIVGIILIIIGGAPISSVGVITYQFSAEVSYPVSEVQAISVLNMASKLITFGFA